MDDQPGFDELFRQGYPRLVSALAVAVDDQEVAADAVQDAFVQALRHWRKVSTYDRPEAWVRRVALNRVVDHQRRHALHDRTLRRVGPEAAAPPAEHEADGLDLARALARLPLKQRLAITLFYVADLPVAEVADLLNVSDGTIKSNLADARRALAPLLEVHDGG